MSGVFENVFRNLRLSLPYNITGDQAGSTEPAKDYTFLYGYRNVISLDRLFVHDKSYQQYKGRV
jgi:hypothetical protein